MITVGITTFNRIDLLRETINSVLTQTFTNLEIIVANDNPRRTLTFESLGISQDARIRLVNHPSNLGEIENLNWLMNQALNPYFIWLADDDLLHPQFFEMLIKRLIAFPEDQVVYTNYASAEKLTNEFQFPASEMKFEILDVPTFLLRYSDRSLNLIGCYGLFKLELLKSIGGFKKLGSGYSPGGDTLIPVRICSKTRIHYLDQKLVFFRSHSESMSINSDNMESFLSAEIDFISYSTESVSKCDPKIQKEVYAQFRSWFQDNHFTISRRIGGTNTARFLFSFLRSEISNLKLFYPYNLGVLSTITYLGRGLRLLLVRVARDAIFPKSRFRILNSIRRVLS
jgi:glycosyltransferase involved in cell wall biosynthesis